MSQVSLLAADRPMPLYASSERRTRLVSTPDGTLSVDEDGFSVAEHQYYRYAVDLLGLRLKPFQYELNLRDTPQDLRWLRTYLESSCKPGEQVELWNLWVGAEDAPCRVLRLSGPLDAFALDTLKQLYQRYQTCITIEI